MNELVKFWLSAVSALVISALICFFITPQVIKLAQKIGAVDVPKDNRRMHKEPIPRMGGLAIFLAFAVAAFAFSDVNESFIGFLAGASLLVILGIFDDIYSLNPWVKLVFQFLAAMIPVLDGIAIERLTNFIGSTPYLELGVFSVPVTLIWIVGITNAVNWIDGLDGLACGIASIATLSMFLISVTVGDFGTALLAATLFGACLGFLPFNHSPAQIFMGDTGSMFLGYTLATLSVSGLFKLYAIISFVVPLLVLALPLCDMIVSILRRILTGHSPMEADRQHIHHKLIDIGLSQRQAVLLLYIVSAILGCAAMLCTLHGIFRLIIIGVSIFFVVILSIYVLTLYKQKHKTAANQEK